MAEQSQQHRRALDALLGADGDISKLDSRDFITLIHADLQEIRQLQLAQTETLGAVKEILEAWDDAKGFIKIVKVVGNTVKWMALVGAAFGGAWAAFKYGMKQG